MAFTSRRGRPRKAALPEGNDPGTPELRQKRQLSLTTEAVDLLLQKEQITPEQHWCALHFRWLYTLRYGTATAQSLDPARIKGFLHKKAYTEWQEERETEWKEAIQLLRQQHSMSAVSDCAIYNEFHPKTLPLLVLGLEALEELWCA